MRVSRLMLGLAVLPLAACQEPQALAPTEFEAVFSVGSDLQNFNTHLSGAEEVPARDTPAQGQAKFQLSADGTELSYRLIVANIENVVASHIHVGPAGSNGGVVVFLYGNQPAGGGRIDGVIAEGTITGDKLINALAGQPLSALVEEMRAGNTYVNVHTNDGVAPTNTGAGDFPGGEVRGQIRPIGPSR